MFVSYFRDNIRAACGSLIHKGYHPKHQHCNGHVVLVVRVDFSTATPHCSCTEVSMFTSTVLAYSVEWENKGRIVSLSYSLLGEKLFHPTECCPVRS